MIAAIATAQSQLASTENREGQTAPSEPSAQTGQLIDGNPAVDLNPENIFDEVVNRTPLSASDFLVVSAFTISVPTCETAVQEETISHSRYDPGREDAMELSPSMENSALWRLIEKSVDRRSQCIHRLRDWKQQR